MNKFCPKCGKSVKTGIFCRECNPQTLDYKPINMKICPTKKYFFKGKWTSYEDIDEVTKTVIEKSLKKNTELIEGLSAYPDLDKKTGMKKDYNVIISVEGEEYVIPINVETTSSPGFSKVGSTYFEGILQLRNADREVKKYVNNLIDSASEVYVNKVVDKKDSTDYYFVKKKFLSRIGDKIIEEYGGYMDMNAQLFTQDKQTSKELFRLNVLVQIPPFRKRDVVNKKDELFYVTTTGKHSKCIDLKTGKKFAMKYDPEEVHEYKIVKKQKTTIINTHPLSALSKETYEMVELQNPLSLEIKKNEEVQIAEWEGVAYIVK